jgi:diguanylate cyclase (GGDEF)-like protein
VECEPLPEAVFIDRDMWEKVVLNLLSNAFKHTFEGGISVALRWRTDHAELRISDTGIGVGAEELPKLFQRFHRVKDARSRTIEGSGIGLSLVQELARRHGGEVTVESERGHGSTFTVRVPSGATHLPADLVREVEQDAVASRVAIAHADETLQWLADCDGERPGGGARAGVHDGTRARVLLADDNADMRRHVARLLAPHFDVVTAADGVLALESALASPPDLVLTDVMMPRLDGFGLLAALREQDRTRTIPVIMLSARAGEEASFEGIRAGVDDYLAKPFSAQELIARVSRSLGLARMRRESEQRLEEANGNLTRALDELAVLARTDPVTGLPNRRSWDEELPLALDRARRRPHPVCIALIDLDHLKAFNDTHGHQAGDQLLAHAGTAWRGHLRTTDLVVRFGGDEFAVIMPDCSLEMANNVLDRVCAATPHDQTCSAGLACWNGTETAGELVARADVALYNAKRRAG